MNYLAHSFLSPDKPYVLTGNVVADLIKGSARKEVDLRFLPGIELHRDIDAFTDGHPAVTRFKAALHDRFHKYAPVVSDIYMDHFLVLNWSQYSEWEIHDYIDCIYNKMNSVIDQLPQDAYRRIRNMIEHRWLTVYFTIEGIEEVFSRMNHKLSDKNILKGGGTWLSERIDDFNDIFISFFPELINFVSQSYSIPAFNNRNV